MKARALIECTIDTAHPAAELAAAITAVLSALPDVETRMNVLRALDEEIGRALAEVEQAEETASTREGE